MINDYKNYRVKPKINKDRIINIALLILLVIVSSVRFEPASAEPQLSVVTYDCGSVHGNEYANRGAAMSYQFDCSPRQVVRPLGRGEFAPAYSTDELFRGVCHIVREPEKRAIKQNQAAQAKSIEVRQKRATDHFLQRFDTVKTMLLDHQPNIAIADALSISIKTIQRYISDCPELRELALARPTKGDFSLTRFREREYEIRRALKRDAMWVVALRFGFDRRTLKRLLGEV